MNNCHPCDAAAPCRSAHESINQMYQRTTEMGLKTIFDRHEEQQPQCGFGMTGVCCQLCSHGPCRITSKADRGICGATADTIVARNLVRLASHGAAAYSHHLEEIIKTIKATGQGKTPYTIADEKKLREIAGVVGLDNTKEKNQLAIELADVLLAEMRKGSDEVLALVTLFAPQTRIDAWEKVGIVPGGILSEVRDAMTKSMTSINTDPIDLLLTTLHPPGQPLQQSSGRLPAQHCSYSLRSEPIHRF